MPKHEPGLVTTITLSVEVRALGCRPEDLDNLAKDVQLGIHQAATRRVMEKRHHVRLVEVFTSGFDAFWSPESFTALQWHRDG